MKHILLGGLLAASIVSCKTKNEEAETKDITRWSNDSARATSFTEEMKGYLTLRENDSSIVKVSNLENKNLYKHYDRMHDKAFYDSNSDDNKLDFKLTVVVNTANESDDLIRNGGHLEGKIMPYNLSSGYVTIPSISDKKMKVKNGSFSLFAQDDSSIRKMRYRMRLTSGDEVFYFYGFKNVERNKDTIDLMEIWEDTSTLYVTMFKDTSESKNVDKIANTSFNYNKIPSDFEVVGQGRMRILISDFAKQMTTTRGHGDTIFDRISALAGFGKFFAGSVWQTFKEKNYTRKPDSSGDVYEKSLRKQSDFTRVIMPPTKDGVKLGMEIYKSTGGEKKNFPILLVAGLGVNNLIFTHGHSRVNMVEFLRSQGYDVYVMETRFNTDLMNYAKYGYWTGDDLYKDYEVAMDFVKSNSRKSQMHVLVHCYGSHTFLSSMLMKDWNNRMKDVRSLMLSQATLFIEVPKKKEMQIHTTGEFIKYLQSIGEVQYLSPRKEDDHFGGGVSLFFDATVKTMNTVQLGFPIIDREVPESIEAITERIRFIYGQIHNLSNLTDASKSPSGFPTYYGPASLGHLIHIQRSIKSNFVSDFKGNSLENIAKSKFSNEYKNLPIGIIHGTGNNIWDISGSEKTASFLKNRINKFKFYPIENHGHLDSIYGNANDPATGKGGAYWAIDEWFEEND